MSSSFPFNHLGHLRVQEKTTPFRSRKKRRRDLKYLFKKRIRALMASTNGNGLSCTKLIQSPTKVGHHMVAYLVGTFRLRYYHILILPAQKKEKAIEEEKKIIIIKE